MTRLLRRFLAVLLAATLMVTGVPFVAFAEGTIEPTELLSVIEGESSEELEVEASSEETSTAGSIEDEVEPLQEGSDIAVGETETGISVLEVSAEHEAEISEKEASTVDETLSEEPIEEPAEEPIEEPAEEPTEEPTEELTEEPTEESTGEPGEAEIEIPEGFDIAMLMSARAASACAHSNLYVYESIQNETYRSLGSDEHQYSYLVVSRTLSCSDCGETIQTIAVNKTITQTDKHSWSNRDSSADNELYCRDCNEPKEVSFPCEHNNLSQNEEGNFYCTECYKVVVTNPEQTYCDHSNYTVWESDQTYVSWYPGYQQYNDDEHLKTTITPIYDSEYRFAICNDCDIWLKVLNGQVVSTTTDVVYSDRVEIGVLEAHTFENGVCKYCGAEEEIEEYSCGHDYAFDHLSVGDTFYTYEWSGNGNTHYKATFEVTQECDYCYVCEMAILTGSTGNEYVSPSNVMAQMDRTLEECDIVSNEGGDHCYNCYHYTEESAPEERPTVTITSPASGAPVSPTDVLKVSWEGTLLGYEGEDNDTDSEYVFCHVVVAEEGQEVGMGTSFTVYSAKQYCEIPAGTFEAGKNYVIYITYGNQSSYHDMIGAQVTVKAEGTVTVCDHSAGNYNDALDATVAPVYSNITETTHCVQYSYKRYCKDCGEYIKNVTDEGITPIPHDFSNGDACVCGYVKEEEVCDHSAGNYNDVKDDTVAPVYSNITETTHCVQYSYKRYCKDCGEYIKNVTDEGIIPIPHDFSNENICACGYEKKVVYNISFTSPANGGSVVAGKNLSVSWSTVEGIDHYEFAARYTDEDEQCVARSSVGKATSASVPNVKYNKTLQLWVGAFVKAGDKDPVCSATIQVKTTTCDHRSNTDDWTFIKTFERYDKVDGNYHVLKEISVFDIDCSVCGEKIDNYEQVTYTFPQEKHYKATTKKMDKATDYTSNDDEYHLVNKKAVVIYTCDCGYSWSETVSREGDGATEKHVGVDENGKCTACGYRVNIFETPSNAKDFNGEPKEKSSSEGNNDNAFVISAKTPVWKETGKIRYVEQWDYNYGDKIGFDGFTYESYWGNDKNVWGSGQDPTNLCTRAAASMALSYLGKNVLPKDMKNEFNDGVYYKTAAEAAGCTVEGQGKMGKEIVTTAQFIKWYDQYASDTEGIYSPVSIRAYYWHNKKKEISYHAFTIIGRDKTNSNCFYIADPGTSNHIGKIVLQDVEGELRVAKYIGAEKKIFSVDYKVTDIWRYVASN